MISDFEIAGRWVERRRSCFREWRAQLDFEDMGAILWFYEHDLVFVCVVEWPAGVFLDADMEHCCSNLERTAIGD